MDRTTTGLRILAVAASIGLMAAVFVFWNPGAADASGTQAPQLIPAERVEFAKLATLATDQEKDDFLANAKTLSAAADKLVNVAVALKRNAVVGVSGVEYTHDQVNAIQTEGLAAFYNAVQAGSRGLQIAGITIKTLNNFAAANPEMVGDQPTFCYTGDATKCPGYVEPTPTP